MWKRCRVWIYGVTLCIALPSAAGADPAGLHSEPPEIRPVRLTTPPRIDGRLTEAAWERLPISEPFITYHPTSGERLPQRTDVWAPCCTWATDRYTSGRPGGTIGGFLGKGT